VSNAGKPDPVPLQVYPPSSEFPHRNTCEQKRFYPGQIPEGVFCSCSCRDDNLTLDGAIAEAMSPPVFTPQWAPFPATIRSPYQICADALAGVRTLVVLVHTGPRSKSMKSRVGLNRRFPTDRQTLPTCPGRRTSDMGS
jgi:hypothetical protein